MDYAEEQATEIEALESIYYDSLMIESKNPYCFQLNISGEEDDSEKLSVNIRFSFTPKYPEAAPTYEVLDCDNVEEDDLRRVIDSEIDSSLGMVMIFTIATAVQEYLNDIRDEIKRNLEEERRQLEKEAEAEEAKKFHGTSVTVETFLVWKLKFEEEMKEMRKRKENLGEKRKMTGKELFLSDKNIFEEEVLVGENAGVTIDESLFEDLDDLDLDPDFNPDEFS